MKPWRILATALALACAAPAAAQDRITATHVFPASWVYSKSFLEFVQQTADKVGVPCDTIVATNDRPYNAIVNTANERGCDLIVMTARYRKGLSSLIMSSESTKVLHRASIPVLTFRALMSADHPDKMRAKNGKAKKSPANGDVQLSKST